MDTDLLERLANLEAQLLEVKRRLDMLDDPCKPPNWQRIVDAVARHFHLERQDLFSHSRERRFIWPRQVAHYLCAELLRLEPLDIARLWRTSRDTPRHSCSVVKAVLEANQRPYTADVTSLRSQLSALFGQ